MVDRAQYFKSLEDRYGLPDGYLEKTMMIESRGDIRAYNKDSKAAGPFQFVPDTQKEFNLKNPYSLEESADAAARVAVRNKTSLQRNGIENPSGADLYAAHQQGARGYVDLLRGGDQLAVKVRGEKPVLLNGGKTDMTASEFANRIRTKFSGDDSSPLPKTVEQTATGVFAKPNVDVAENPDQAAALEGQAALSTQDVLDTSNASAGRSGSGLKELGFLHNYFKSLDTSATGVKPLSVPNFFNHPKYKHGGIVSLKEDAKRVRAAGIGGDTVLAHITPSEAALLKSMGGSGRINPRTGLPMFDDGDPGSQGDNQGTSVGEPSDDNSSTTSAADPGMSALGDTSIGGFSTTVGGWSSGVAAPDVSAGLANSQAAAQATVDAAAMNANAAAANNANAAAFGGSIMGGVFGGVSPTVGAVMGTEEMGPAAPNPNSPNMATDISDAQMSAAVSSLNAGLNSQMNESAYDSAAANAAAANAANAAANAAAANATSSNTTSSPNTSSPATMDSSTTKDADNTPDPSSDPMGGGGDGNGGGGKDENGGGVASTPVVAKDTSVKYDVSKFLGDVGKTTYTTPASVYTSYPVGQGIGTLNPNAPKYTGSFYDPTFGKVLYQ